MDRAYLAGASGTPPAAPGSPSTGYPTAGNPATSTPATTPGPYFYHMLVEELMNIITSAGITPAQGTLTQLKQAMDSLYGTSSSVQGAFKNLQASATGLSANVSVSADEIVVENASNVYKTLRSVALTIAGTASGVANGLDTGALAISTWYSLWVIWNGTTTAGLMSLSATAPTLPSGYTHKARAGWVRTDASGNKYPLKFMQLGRSVYYAPAAGSNLTAVPQAATGTAGTVGTTLVSVSLNNYVPPTASATLVSLMLVGSTSIQVSSNSVAAAPGCSGLSNSSNGSNSYISGRLLYESSNIYWASNGASNGVSIQGWEDNL